MRLTKLHGCGNDYLYLDCTSTPAPADPAALARVVADRHLGVGSDGLILVLPSRRADVRMRMFNADGSEGAMCGNGVRALAKFAFDRGLTRNNPLTVETLRGVLSIQVRLDDGGKVDSATVDMDEPILDARRIPVVLDGHDPGTPAVAVPLSRHIRLAEPSDWIAGSGLEDEMTCVSMGSAHAVMFCRDVRAVPLEVVGPQIERDRVFPDRVNAHFAQVVSPKEVTMRTWEKGSGITLACGTGACAVVVAGVLTGRLGRDVLVHLPGGDLHVLWRENDNHVIMTGPAVEVFSVDWPHGTRVPGAAG